MKLRIDFNDTFAEEFDIEPGNAYWPMSGGGFFTVRMDAKNAVSYPAHRITRILWGSECPQ